MKLTKRVIDAAPSPSGTQQVFLRDEALRGFGVKVTSGSKTFYIERRIHGRSRRLCLGRYGEVTLEEARRLALEKIVEIGRGHDPVAARRQQRRSTTWQQLEAFYLERHAIHKKSKASDKSLLKLHLSPWRHRPITSITRADVSTLHAEMGKKHPTSANRMIALAKTMFNLASDWGLHPGPNPAAKVKLFKEVERDRFVTPGELPRLWTALNNEPNPYVRTAFIVSLLTGARQSEVLTMQWSDLDLPQCLWRIPDTKAGRSHYVPLALPAVEEILRLPRLSGNPYVFCGRWGRGHLVNVAKPWRRIKQEAGLNDVRVHDLRRTLGSWMVAAGASLPLIGKALNHSRPETTQIYARLQLDPVRAALDANAAKMLTVIETAEKKGLAHAED